MSSKSTIRQRSAVIFLYVHQLPRWVPLVVLPALLIAGLAVPGPIGSVLLILLAFGVWFIFMASPTRSPAHRAIRFAVPLVIIAVAIGKLLT